ncbi:hypothetical protein QYE76_036790 [Lolium multiflorum]|uniref:Uncharacterized protein n=1 Tax=Lolium multiflorum TaxID=4521 RepID=A0AAD8R2M3_LOLMU|nr:hypothetical protein QYE76_036790 [Lolium multiflorum]
MSAAPFRSSSSWADMHTRGAIFYAAVAVDVPIASDKTARKLTEPCALSHALAHGAYCLSTGGHGGLPLGGPRDKRRAEVDTEPLVERRDPATRQSASVGDKVVDVEGEACNVKP